MAHNSTLRNARGGLDNTPFTPTEAEARQIRKAELEGRLSAYTLMKEYAVDKDWYDAQIDKLTAQLEAYNETKPVIHVPTMARRMGA